MFRFCDNYHALRGGKASSMRKDPVERVCIGEVET